MKLDVSKVDLPRKYELHGGPFDGSFICLGVDFVFDLPPSEIRIICDPEKSRGAREESYGFDRRLEFGSSGEPTGETLGYFYRDGLDAPQA